MKDIVNKRFWVIFFTLNLVTSLIYLAFSFKWYSLLLGHIAGVISFLIFISLTYLAIKLVVLKKPNNKLTKTRALAIFLMFLVLVVNSLIILAFIMINRLVVTHYAKSSVQIGLWPINMFTFSTPYLLVIFVGLVDSLAKNKQTKRKDENG
ncbi:Uncharacterised protein [Metamycoplasma arthritidis]|uniref:Hypothetical membrane protein n=2 Tax=Metamycoplasma arthritidis TaxID=2111 RepID=B3PLV1_META1|nr:hypothetical membrane protein [Metamycoplasma arthritidis 158L3-1]VEU78531.1 Uncharacterised protein [Metamycoplasma arthritidis]